MTMLYLFFVIGWIAMGIAVICGPIGYVFREHRWVYSVGDYFRNLGRMILQAACGLAIVWLYVHFLGWPEPN